METGGELRSVFNSQSGEHDFGVDLIPFEVGQPQQGGGETEEEVEEEENDQQEEEEGEENSTIEVAYQSTETVPEGAINDEDGGGGGVSEEQEPGLGMEFDSLESARVFYFNYAERLGFRVRASRFRTSRRDESIIMRRFVCFKEGFYLKREKKRADAKERRKRGSIREGCQAMFEVVRKDTDRWVLAKLVLEHTHPFANAVKSRKPKKKKLEPVFPFDVRSLFGEAFGSDRQQGYWGGGGEAFNLMEYFKRMQAKNPGFFYAVRVDESNNVVSNVFWADTRARMAYSYFGDAIALDTTYKKNKHMTPFLSFTGVNHHLQPVVFGCGVISDESEVSFSWLFETFLTAMGGHHPVSLVTEQNEALRMAVAKVLPGTQYRYCKWWILRKCKEELPNLCLNREVWCSFKGEMKKCIDESETIEDFESGWAAILIKYNIQDNMWLQSLYEIRQQWATVYVKDTFFAEMSPSQRSETMNKFFQRNFESKTAIRDFIAKFDQAMTGQYEKEVQADFANLYTRPVLKTSLQIEKQAADTYTKTIFAIFQEEFVQSSNYSYSVDKCEDGINWKYHVMLNSEDGHKTYTVNFNYPEKKASCSCRKFEFSGILCRHVLTVFSGLRVRKIPEEYFLKRWSRTAKSDPPSYESCAQLQNGCQKALLLRCNDLCLDVLKFAAEGAISSEIYGVAKEALQKAFAEVVTAKKTLHSRDPGK